MNDSSMNEEFDEDDSVAWQRIEVLTGKPLRLVKIALKHAMEKLKDGTTEEVLWSLKNLIGVLRNYK